MDDLKAAKKPTYCCSIVSLNSTVRITLERNESISDDNTIVSSFSSTTTTLCKPEINQTFKDNLRRLKKALTAVDKQNNLILSATITPAKIIKLFTADKIFHKMKLEFISIVDRSTGFMKLRFSYKKVREYNNLDYLR